MEYVNEWEEKKGKKTTTKAFTSLSLSLFSALLIPVVGHYIVVRRKREREPRETNEEMKKVRSSFVTQSQLILFFLAFSVFLS